LIAISSLLQIAAPRTTLIAGFKAIDWIGMLTSIAGTVMFLLGLVLGGSHLAWSSATVISLILFGTIVLGIFIMNEWKFARSPIIPGRLFKHRSNIAALTVCFCHGFVYIGGAYYLPLYFQGVLSATPLLSAMYLLPFVLSLSTVSALVGNFISKTGNYLAPIRLGMALMTLGFGLFIDFNYKATWSKIVIFQIVAGMGTGLNFQAPLLALQALVDQGDTATATATFVFLRQLATSISVVLGGVVIQDTMGSEIVGLTNTKLAVNVRGLKHAWIFYTSISALGAIGSTLVQQRKKSEVDGENTTDPNPLAIEPIIVETWVSNRPNQEATDFNPSILSQQAIDSEGLGCKGCTAAIEKDNDNGDTCRCED
jgi:hypothetical protein